MTELWRPQQWLNVVIEGDEDKKNVKDHKDRQKEVSAAHSSLKKPTLV